ncbi:MAG: hypothetical protein IKT94_05000 [Rikenellaceae bacterium]|nr:hypothetical protein [Rikenellaceae bacterium]
MKKLVLIVFVAVFGALNANAQEVDSLEIDQKSIIDSLSMELTKLRHEYDFLQCDYELFQLQSKLQAFLNEVNIKSNSVLITYYNNRFDVDLYISYLDNYNSCVELFDAMKNSVALKKRLIEAYSDKFSYLSNDYFSSVYYNLLDGYLTQIQNALDYYKITIDTYKKSRR